jgi:hypothetical protein
MQRRRGFGLVVLVAVTLVTQAADAKIALRPRAPHDSFVFHGNYSSRPFDPTSAFGIAIWNCADGTMPTFIADREPLVVCGFDAATGYVLAERVYEVGLPAGACVDHGRSCYYRDGAAVKAGGVRYLRVQYARRGHGNRVWLESYGDLSAADQANMLVVIEVDGTPRALLQDTFAPITSGGWFSRF